MFLAANLSAEANLRFGALDPDCGGKTETRIGSMVHFNERPPASFKKSIQIDSKTGRYLTWKASVLVFIYQHLQSVVERTDMAFSKKKMLKSSFCNVRGVSE